MRGGWELGASGHHTRRANSVAPEPGGAGALDARIDEVEAWYGARGLAPVFKLTPAADPVGLDDALAARGYTSDGETLVMTAAVDEALVARSEAPAGRGRQEILAGRLDPDWFAASCALSAIPKAQRADYRRIVERGLETQRIVLFGSVERDARIASVAMGAVVEDVVSVAAVATETASRGEGLAASNLSAILFAAREHDAERALLSVEASNHAARRLYERLGFVERYRYWYREKRSRNGPARSGTARRT